MKIFSKILLSFVLVAFAQTSRATDLYVTTEGENNANDCTTESSPCLTLEYALLQAVENDVIHIGGGDFLETDTLLIDVPLSIVGLGTNFTTITRSGVGTNTFFDIQIPDSYAPAPVVIQDLLIDPIGNGVCIDSLGTGLGAFASVDLTVENVFFNGCNVENGAGIRFSNSETLTITDSEFVNGIASDTSGGGILIETSSSITVTDSYFSNNQANDSGSAIFIYDVGFVSISSTTFAENIIDSNAGALYCGTCPDVTLENVTFSNNSGTSDPNEATEMFFDNSTVTLNHVTVHNTVNTDDHLLIAQNGSSVTTSHSIFYQTAATDACNTSLTSMGFNLSSDSSCVTAGNDWTDATDPFDGITLAYNGGPVKTLALTPTSPAYNFGDLDCPVATDARGVERPISGACDIGAFEFACGNSVVEDDFEEQCDDGAVIDADGCSSLCLNETLWYADADADGYGELGSDGVFAVEQPVGFVANELDCDDTNAEVSPDAEDVCDDVDNDCNGTVDDDFADDLGDACSAGTGACEDAGEIVCNDAGTGTECDAVAGEASTELCGDEIDNDCDGDTDEGFDDLGDACTTGLGACEAIGEMVCTEDGLSTECNAITGTEEDEVCDDEIDNDCDGDLDADDEDCIVSGDDDDTTGGGSGGCALQPHPPTNDYGLNALLCLTLLWFGWRMNKKVTAFSND